MFTKKDLFLGVAIAILVPLVGMLVKNVFVTGVIVGVIVGLLSVSSK